MSSPLKEKKIILGVTGGIAAFKVADWIRKLKNEGADVTVVMTDSATKFVTPITFAALSGNPVYTDTFSPLAAEQIPHIQLAHQADLLLIAPATANIISKLAHGLADNLLSTIALAAKGRILVCPAMNCTMYAHPATQQNIERIRSLGYEVAEPETGELACGEEGPGRLPDYSSVRHTILKILSDQDLKGLNILVTAGPTKEKFDPVRFISNRSSGKMGYALAATACYRGANVTLVSGPTNLAPPTGVSFVPVISADDMYEAVMEQSSKTDIIVKAAAVSDFKPATVQQQKIKKSSATLTMTLASCPDILDELGKNKAKGDPSPFLVGFAAESEKHLAEGKRKLKSKHLDLIVVNDIANESCGFEVDTNKVSIIDRDENITELPLLSKEETANHIWDNVLRLLNL